MATTTVPAAVGFLTRETLAGAAQFTGAVGAGQFAFNAADTFVLRPNQVPRILSLGYASLGAAHTVKIFLARSIATGDTERFYLGGSRIKDDGTFSLTNFATLGCCCLGAPGVAAGGVIGAYYQIQISTTGKTDEATWSMFWEPANAL